jgi:hypothetical protein
MVIDVPLLLGIIGMLFVLFGFIMIQTHRWSPDDMAYDVINVIGSGLLMYYAFVGHAWPFFILNGVFVLYSLKDAVKDCKKKYSKLRIRP